MRNGTGYLARLLTIVITNVCAGIVLWQTVGQDLDDRLNLAVFIITVINFLIFDGMFLASGMSTGNAPTRMILITEASVYAVVQSVFSAIAVSVSMSVVSYIIVSLIIALAMGLSLILVVGHSPVASEWGRPNADAQARLNAQMRDSDQWGNPNQSGINLDKHN